MILFYFADRDLPTASPWKCPKCPYLGNDLRALRVHYGVRHKIALNLLASKLNLNPTVLKKEIKKTKNANKLSLQQQNSKTELLKDDSSKLKSDMSFVQPTQQKPPPAQQPQPSQQPSQTTQQVEMQKQLEESKRFPKCKLCDYRYFTRLDLCRHFVDFHLRQRLVNCIDPQSQR